MTSKIGSKLYSIKDKDSLDYYCMKGIRFLDAIKFQSQNNKSKILLKEYTKFRYMKLFRMIKFDHFQEESIVLKALVLLKKKSHKIIEKIFIFKKIAQIHILNHLSKYSKLRTIFLGYEFENSSGLIDNSLIRNQYKFLKYLSNLSDLTIKFYVPIIFQHLKRNSSIQNFNIGLEFMYLLEFNEYLKEYCNSSKIFKDVLNVFINLRLNDFIEEFDWKPHDCIKGIALSNFSNISYYPKSIIEKIKTLNYLSYHDSLIKHKINTESFNLIQTHETLKYLHLNPWKGLDFGLLKFQFPKNLALLKLSLHNIDKTNVELKDFYALYFESLQKSLVEEFSLEIIPRNYKELGPFIIFIERNLEFLNKNTKKISINLLTKIGSSPQKHDKSHIYSLITEFPNLVGLSLSMNLDTFNTINQNKIIKVRELAFSNYYINDFFSLIDLKGLEALHLKIKDGTDANQAIKSLRKIRKMEILRYLKLEFQTKCPESSREYLSYIFELLLLASLRECFIKFDLFLDKKDYDEILGRLPFNPSLKIFEIHFNGPRFYKKCDNNYVIDYYGFD